MKTVEFQLDGQVYHLILNGAALFDAYDEFGTKGDLLDLVTGTSRESFDHTCWMLVKLAQQGEAVRRFQGEDPMPMLTPMQAQRLLGPVDVVRARAAIRAAFAQGFEREAPDEEEEIDLGLAELQKKTGLASRGRGSSNGRRRFWDSLFGRA